jgi:hypothetical protein
LKTIGVEGQRTLARIMMMMMMMIIIIIIIKIKIKCYVG